MLNHNISHEELLRLLAYDKDTGLFSWRVSYRRKPIGTIAGFSNGNGYVATSIYGRGYLCHRLAWFYVTGEWPVGEIDHIDGDRANNRFANLRVATRAENAANQGPQSSNKLRLRGVFPSAGRYRAQITKGGKTHSLGYFDDPHSASSAYRQAARKLHGEFCR